MSVKKPAAKVKEKRSHSSDAAFAKRKPSQETESKPVMDARSNKDRRDGDRRKKEMSVDVERRAGVRRIKVNRRRQIDPTTCERDYSPEEVEFMSALDDYKRRSGRMFPTCSEILEVIKGLGYEKHIAELSAAVPAASAESAAVVGSTAEQAV